jgi:hypothetical protein
MKLKSIALLAAFGLGSAALLGQPALAAKPPKPAAASAGVLKKTVPLAPRGLKWGMNLEQIAKLYDKILEDEFKPRFLKANGPQVLQIEDELREKQAVLRRSRIEFKDVPTGIDQGPLKGEYTYGNGESLARFTPASGTPRNFFFFKDKLWKVYDEHKLGPDSPLGATYDAALKALAARFEAEPKRVPADYQKGQNFDEAVWQDGEKIIRAVDRGDVIGMVYVDRAVQEKLAEYRPNKAVDHHELDRDVAAATSRPPASPSAAPKPQETRKGR